MAKIGDNSGVSGERIRAFVERIEKLNSSKDDICEDIKNVYAEAKGQGFDVATIRELVRLRKKTIEQRHEQLELFSLYASAIGMEV